MKQFKEQRKQLKRDINCRIVDPKGKEIREYIKSMLTDCFNAFPDVDCRDLMMLIITNGNYLAGRENICAYDE